MAAKIYSWLIRTGIFLGAGVALALYSERALGSEKVIFTYGGLTQSVPLEELEEFAGTGKISPALRSLLKHGDRNPFVMRWILRQEFPANTKLISDMLNTPPGEYVLSQTGNVVGAKSERANVEALRGALIASASDDDLVSLMELLANYPTSEVYVNGKVLAKLRVDFNQLVNETSRYLRIPLNLPQN